MKSLQIILLSLTLLPAVCHAATVTALGASVSTYVSENAPATVTYNHSAVDFTNPSLPDTDPANLPVAFDSHQLADFQGNGGNGNVNAHLDDLAYSTPNGPGTFSYSATNFGGTSVTEAPKANSPNDNSIDIRSYAEYSISFELSGGETMQANFDLTYSASIDNDNQNSANIFWELTDSNSVRSSIFYEFTYTNDPVITPFNETFVVDQSTTLSGDGIYTFTLYAEIPDQAFKNSKKDVVVSFDSINFEVTNIPEPSSAALLMLAAGSFIVRIKR